MAEYYDIKVRDGDTLVYIARREYGHEEGIDLILEDNPTLQSATEALVPGTVLKIRDSAPELDQKKLLYVRQGKIKQVIRSTGAPQKSLSELIAEADAADIKAALSTNNKLQPLIAAMTYQELEDTVGIDQRNTLTRIRSGHTGSPTSFATGDDAWHAAQADAIKAHRKVQVNFYQLLVNNPFGHKYRFCGVTGGYVDETGTYRDIQGTMVTRAQAFPDSYCIDMLTGLGWYLTLQAAATWANAIAAAEAFTATADSVLLDGWRVPSFKEFMDVIKNTSNSVVLNQKPFEFGITDTWTSTSRNSTISRYVHPELQMLQSGNSTLRTYMLCRNHHTY